MSETNLGAPRASSGTVAVLAVLLVTVCIGTLAATPAAAEQHDTPTVENVTTTVDEGNVTVQVQAANVTEIDIRSVPSEWSVVGHNDDDGAFGGEIGTEGVVRWFWTIQVETTVSVTFAPPEDPVETAPDLEVVPYAGTERGTPEAVAVTDLGSNEAEQTATDSGGDGESDDSSGPGFVRTAGIVGLVCATALVLIRARRRSG